MNTIPATYDVMLVGLSFLVAVFGSYTALQLAMGIPEADKGAMVMWLTGAALALGGGAIWSMHFIGMLAYEVDIPLAYDAAITFASLLIAVVVTGLGLLIVGRSHGNPWKLVIGGIFTGLGVAAMHYTGMEALIMPADLTYSPLLFAASIVIALVAATAALWLAFNMRGTAQRFGSAVVMGLAVCGMHYTGMAAAILTPIAGDAPKALQTGISQQELGIYVFVIAVTLLTVLLVVGIYRSSEEEMRADLES